MNVLTLDTFLKRRSQTVTEVGVGIAWLVGGTAVMVCLE